ncbi:MAG: hypothetical protein AB7Q17_08610 [Phycisphaerae bacterium]
MIRPRSRNRRATILLMVVGMLAILFVIVTAYLTLARFDRLSLEQLEDRRIVERTLDGVNDLVLAALRAQFADASGNLMSGAGTDWSYETIPGYGKSFVVASLEPIALPTSNAGLGTVAPETDVSLTSTLYGELGRYQYPALTSLSQPGVPVLVRPTGANQTWVPDRIAQMLRDYNEDGVISLLDLRPNTRLPFMDADGDGIPDASFVGSAPGSELAAAIAGQSVRVPNGGLYPAFLRRAFQGTGSIDPGEAAWRQYSAQARYEIAVRVISHGGMVALGSRGVGGQFVGNRFFVDGMFRWLIKDNTSRSLLDRDGNGRDNSDTIDLNFNTLAESAPAIEPILRRRGGLLATYALDPLQRMSTVRVPEALRLLEDPQRGFPETFVSEFRLRRGETPKKQQNWQRFALVRGSTTPDAGEWQAWKSAAALDALGYLDGAQTPTVDDLYAYDRRHLLTTVNQSDELARNLNAGKRQLSEPRQGLVGLKPGEAKFYLGDITSANPAVGVFGTGTAPGDPRFIGVHYNTVNGAATVRRLANYYFEMLSQYREWPDTSGQNSDEVSLVEQAYMLAVNTVSFAMPRSIDGFTDVITHLSAGATGQASTRYIGYGPQVFFTDVILHRDASDNYAVAMEFYNPNEPLFAGGVDVHALNLAQFGVTLGDVDPNDPAGAASLIKLASATQTTRLEGRAFTAFIARSGSNSELNGLVPGIAPVAASFTPNASGNGTSINVRLWKLASNGVWFAVDEAEAEAPALPSNDNRWGRSQRDKFDAPFLGGLDPLRPARWGMVTAKTDESSSSFGGSLPSRLGVQPQTPQLQPIAPQIPLYLMNAGPGNSALNNGNDLLVHGTLRPRNFPTVGFLLHVPRFAGMQKEDSSSVPPLVTSRVTMPEMLAKHWDRLGVPVSPPEQYPADIGHMPVFDNDQNVLGSDTPDPSDDSYFAGQNAGRIPWGLLVFDYFTTVDTRFDAGDDATQVYNPLAVPGRIDINAAPWYVLAGLPVLNPGMQLRAATANAHFEPSPAFWSSDAGVLRGVDSTGVVRFDPTRLDQTPGAAFDPATGSYRLGAALAIAAASYRDRVPYVPTGYAAFADAEQRNAGDIDRPEGVYGGARRDNPADVRGHRGFLSVGELAHVRTLDLADPVTQGFTDSPLGRGDYIKAVSVLTLLDSHFLTTRGNTFTVYVTVTDREKPQSSVRSQMTIDRGSVLPTVIYSNTDINGDGVYDENDRVVTLPGTAAPTAIGQREVGYFNAQFDE